MIKPFIIENDVYITNNYIEQCQREKKEIDESLILTMQWIRDFIGKPHPLANRNSPICPKVPDAIEIDAVYLRLIKEPNLSEELLVEITKKMAKDFFALPPTEGKDRIFKSTFLVIAEPALEISVPIIDKIQRQLKGEILNQCIMLGRFHKLIKRGSIHNKDFNPHKAPVPLLSLRYMVETDIGFLSFSAAEPMERKKYLETYLHLLGDISSEKLIERAENEIKNLNKLIL